MIRATAGQNVVFHTAGKVTDWGPRAEYFQVNTEGTRNFLAACRESGVRRLVHVSSLSVLGLPRTREMISEESPYPRSLPDPYSASKKAAEQLVLPANGEGGLATTVVIFESAVLAAVGAAAVPSAGLVTMVMVAQAVGLDNQ